MPLNFKLTQYQNAYGYLNAERRRYRAQDAMLPENTIRHYNAVVNRKE